MFLHQKSNTNETTSFSEMVVFGNLEPVSCYLAQFRWNEGATLLFLQS